MKTFKIWIEHNHPEELDPAGAFAKERHDATGKIRKLSGLPYFTHPSNVAGLLRSAGASPEVVMAGYLHDTTEDAGVSLEEIAAEFGDRVAELVAGSSEPDKGASWDERKRHTISHLSNISDEEVLQVVVADKLDNLEDTHRNGGPGIWEKFNAPYEKQRWYYSTLAEVFVKKIPNFPLTKRYKEMVTAVFGGG
jgi:(p)ppGpp synthase/HD superfamily hydrolase